MLESFFQLYFRRFVSMAAKLNESKAEMRKKWKKEVEQVQ
jgi:hypothetical protein